MRTFARSVLVASLLLPVSASAHESRLLDIDGERFRITVGSLNEPVAVDDKTGVDVTVSRVSSTGALAPVTGLESSWMVELRADGQTRDLPLEARYGMPGKYQAPFYPTVETTYAYRVRGPLHGRTIDLTFTCNAEGHAMHGQEHVMDEDLAPGIRLVSMRGGFGCPQAKEGLGFPQDSASIRSLRGGMNAFDGAALVLAFAALAVALKSLRRNP